MKDDQHYIDRIFNEALNDFKELPDDGAWEGIAGAMKTPEAVATKTVLWKQYLGAFFIAGYLLIGPLFYSDLLFDSAPFTVEEMTGTSLEVEPERPELLTSRRTLDENSSVELTGHSGGDSHSQNKVEIAATQPHDEASDVKDNLIEPADVITSTIKETDVDPSKQEERQGDLTGVASYVPWQPNEVEDVVGGLHALDYAYKTFLFPVLENPVPIDSTDEFEYYEKAWKWYRSAYVMPVYWTTTGIARAQIGFDVGRYLNGNSSIQIGLRYQLSSGDHRIGDSGVLTIPLQYRRYFGKSHFKWFLGAGTVFTPGLSPGTPFDNTSFRSSFVDLEFATGIIYRPSDKMRFFLSPTWQQPLSGEHGVSVQLGLQFRF